MARAQKAKPSQIREDDNSSHVTVAPIKIVGKVGDSA